MLELQKRFLVVANWKANGDPSLLEKFIDVLSAVRDYGFRVMVVIAPPFTAFASIPRFSSSNWMQFAAQNCASDDTRVTGEITAQAIKNAGCQYVIVGHGERRQLLMESDSLILSKMHAALEAGLIPIVCVGDTDQERTAGISKEILLRQCTMIKDAANSNTIILAYEPLWAIGASCLPSTTVISEMIVHIKSICDFPVMYGGSVNEQNVHNVFESTHISGLLVGRSSLELDKLLKIVETCYNCCEARF